VIFRLEQPAIDDDSRIFRVLSGKASKSLSYHLMRWELRKNKFNMNNCQSNDWE
jgi:hypothetical protein